MYYYLVSLSKKQLLSYHSETKLEVGDLVLASIRTKQDVGLIISEVPKPKFKTKALEQVLYKKFVSSKQIQFAKLIANFYMCKPKFATTYPNPKLLTKGSLKILDNKTPTPTNLEVDLKHTLGPKQSDVFTNKKRKFSFNSRCNRIWKNRNLLPLNCRSTAKKSANFILSSEINLTPQLLIPIGLKTK